MNGRCVCIVNPRSGAGATLAAFREAEHALLDHFGELDVLFTEAPGHATALCREALERGADRVLVGGGDGTAGEVLQAFFHKDLRPVSPETVLNLLVGGTGGDLRRTLGIGDREDSLRAIYDGTERALDVGYVDYTTKDHDTERRFFLNVASMGLSGLVVRHVPRWGGLGARVGYLAATAQALLGWRNPRVRIQIRGADGHFEADLRVAVIAVANGRYFGGGMQIAPEADPGDGSFQVTILGDLRRRDFVMLSQAIRDGRHLDHPLVFARHGDRVTAESDDTVVLEIDGEPLGQLPATFGLLPRAIRVGCP